MAVHSQNGNGGAVILPPLARVISGRGLSHRKLDKRQLAVMAANAYDGQLMVVPTMKHCAGMFGVSVTYVRLALGFSPDKREAILRGLDPTSFATLLIRKTGKTKVINTEITDAELIEAVRVIGTNRVLNAAVAVEAAE